jgi:transforming growth factor-beta-induced protein
MKTLHMLRRASVAVAMLSVLSACSDDDATSPEPNNTVFEVASGDTRLTSLVEALETAELEASLDGTGPFTVFAPINTAFDALPNGVADALLESENRSSLEDLLRYHVVPGRYTRAQLTDGLQLTTLSGQSLTVRVGTDGLVTVDGVAVVDADVDASNGVIHTVGRVLTQGLDVVELATILPDLSTLVGAIETAGLGTTLSAEGSALTLFAPNNASFAALGNAVPTDPAALAQVLQLHVVNSRNSTNMLTNAQMLTSLLGPELTVTIDGSAIQITGPTNTVNVTVTDLTARNGIIHVIDAVLLPQ